MYACMTRSIASCIAVPLCSRELNSGTNVPFLKVEPSKGGRHGPGDTMFAVRKADGACAQLSGRTELKCVFCDRLDPMEIRQSRRNGPMARLLFLFPSRQPLEPPDPRSALVQQTRPAAPGEVVRRAWRD